MIGLLLMLAVAAPQTCEFTCAPCPPCEVEMTCETPEMLGALDSLNRKVDVLMNTSCPSLTCPEADTAESVMEGVQQSGSLLANGAGMDRGDYGVGSVAHRSWSSRHPVATAFLVGLGFTAFNAVAHHNEWLWYDHDEGERGRRGRRGQAGKDGTDDGGGGGFCPPGQEKNENCQ